MTGMKSTARADQFYTRTGNESTKGSRKGFSLLGGGVNPTAMLSPEQQRLNQKASLVAKLNAANVELAKLKVIVVREAKYKSRAFYEALERRTALVAEAMTIHSELSLIKKDTADIGHARIERCFVDIAKDVLPSGQFKTIMAAAISAAQEENKT